ncbi:MarR family winged helix-turn-helix transcriptional regulator [Enemella evansiae]|uniref:MarR family transcriptional regulator n=1 Tax=Enemella evansiae TaxID=2016499 RepID=A0A255GNX8_9ACTN|nr:MarR family transcriptional regulator [Enemella evansiae]PFG69127.1 DNA-binding MarR family transcriptional regulator [Propionibacteriaceae bacterium ES.041]OYO00755.1 MarR family transcriptional regulator [Enemella evansiae]OYO02615.1 MarR family transcriptional regulator [Enemella evansiae]OYO12012.1 MarR family transcriptional regulator [Enemella evansiae]OYO14044.1 MarR family transcriptional regulator [Enemella evansiae]
MSESASGAWAQVAAFASAVDANLDKWLGDTYRLGLTEYRALTFLSQSPDKELRIAALAQRVGLTSTSTTRLVSRLESKGHARRDVCEDDGRGVYAVIDEPGEELCREIQAAFDARVEELLSNPAKHFPHLDARALASALQQVRALVKP